ncbi:hypothetical protein F5050DRAFT_1716376 [Lentinula boryana]|uniref:CxC1-like cysteine cluster associated with KDZ transposases domain-containing protein n=1 Tax=Lentinula boryana TaxID=40481 RepID=A0ABQ8Q068_9AGAR|nr:hypothetical protein F5050DRAFT_1716376 [Lentinula boryana]
MNPSQRNQKIEQARRDFVTWKIVTTNGRLHQRIQRERVEGVAEGMQQVYTEVLMDLDEYDDDGDLGNAHSSASHTGTGDRENEWEDEEAAIEEQLLYFRTREALQDYDFQGCWNQSKRILIDQDCWDEQMTKLVDAYMDYCNRRQSDVAYDGIVKEKHCIMCPRLGIQPFIRALCDLQGVRFKNNLLVQISAAYDLYIRLVEGVRLKVQQALGRDALNWRMLNNCPCCQYEVVGELELAIQMLLGINKPPSEDGKSLGPEKEREDNRVGGGDYFLQPEAVDLWDESQWHKWPRWTPKECSPKIPCEDCWSNLKESNTHRTFGHFDVNGVFGGFCRHSFTIVFLDMIRTGEHSKYMLALLNHFMSASCEDRQHLGLAENPSGSLGIGYNIACSMTAKIIWSPLNDLAQKERLSMMIGLLHGYAHN